MNCNLSPINLTCEYMENPVGLTISKPRLFWTVHSACRGQVQSAYQILAASSPEDLADNRGKYLGQWDCRIRSKHPHCIRRQSTEIRGTLLLESACVGR